MKRIAETLGVARSNLVERVDGKRPKRGPQIRAGDVELTSDIRRLVDARPSYGYRRIAALLKRARRSAGHDPVNAKRVYRLMKKGGLLLARHTGRRIPRAHAGTIMTSHSNVRWCSDALEFTCWNGEIVRVAFARDSHDREVISWVATTAGISGEIIRDMMVHCVERRFGDMRAPRKVQWLSDNGSIFAAYRTLEIAAALNLEPCFTPVESPESNGMAEAFVKTFKRDYVRVNPIPRRAHRAAADRPLDGGLQLRTSAFPAGYRSPREYIASLEPAECPV
ncbi:putative transposase [Bradyrhizobium sp. USDA 4486]